MRKQTKTFSTLSGLLPFDLWSDTFIAFAGRLIRIHYKQAFVYQMCWIFFNLHHVLYIFIVFFFLNSWCNLSTYNFNVRFALRFYDPDNLARVQPATICWFLSESPTFYSNGPASVRHHNKQLVVYTLREPEVSTKHAAHSGNPKYECFHFVLVQQLCKAFLSVLLGVEVLQKLCVAAGHSGTEFIKNGTFHVQ